MNNKPSIADRAKAIAARVWPMMSQDHVAESVAAFGEELYREGQIAGIKMVVDEAHKSGSGLLSASEIRSLTESLRSQDQRKGG